MLTLINQAATYITYLNIHIATLLRNANLNNKYNNFYTWHSSLAPTTHYGKSFHSFTILIKNEYLHELKLDALKSKLLTLVAPCFYGS